MLSERRRWTHLVQLQSVIIGVLFDSIPWWDHPWHDGMSLSTPIQNESVTFSTDRGCRHVIFRQFSVQNQYCVSHRNRMDLAPPPHREEDKVYGLPASGKKAWHAMQPPCPQEHFTPNLSWSTTRRAPWQFHTVVKEKKKVGKTAEHVRTQRSWKWTLFSPFACTAATLALLQLCFRIQGRRGEARRDRARRKTPRAKESSDESPSIDVSRGSASRVAFSLRLHF